jgi:hypothetical protein
MVVRGSEHQLHARYSLDGWPVLVQLRNGCYAGAVSRMQDWGIGIPVVGAEHPCH